MTRRLTVAEQLAAADKDLLLSEIAKTDDWSQLLVMQAVLVFGYENETFSCNQLRDVLPDLGHGFLGAAINALRTGGVIQHTGQYVPSTSPGTNAHPIAVWRLSVKGLLIAEQRRAARREGGMSADRKALLRQLEGRLRNCWQGEPLADIRWRLGQTGMTDAEIWAFEDAIRRRIREERADRRAA